MKSHRTILGLAGVGFLIGCLVLAAGCGEPPTVVVESEYLRWQAWEDPPVCIDHLLAQEDRFIEEMAALLGVEPPSKKIEYNWVPEGSDADSSRWPCPDFFPEIFVQGCYHRSGEAVYAMDPLNQHELVHAVDFSVYRGVHYMLREGIAEYLSKPETAFALPEDARADFPARLRAGIGEEPTDYPAAMHFVGALVTTHGLEKYLEFHTRVRKHARWRGFERAYREIYGGDLATDLEAMAELPITGHVPDAPGLCRGFGVIEPWEAIEPGHSGEEWATRLRLTIAEAPPPPEAPARPWLCAQVGVEVEVAGFYAVLLVDEGGELPRGPVGGLWGCPGSYEGAGFVPNSEVFTYLSEGRFYIDLQVPPRPLEAAPLAVEIELVKPASGPTG